MKFEDLGLSRELLNALADSGYDSPTPIQAKAIPYVLMGRDILGCAQTGTGKTASFTLPMIDILAEGRAKARMPRSLILAPTRELAAQVAESFDRYGKYHKLNKALLIGGTSMSDQEQVLDRGADVLIATPGRLIDLFERGKILLADVKVLVIDEADRMLDMGFIPDVERIVSLLPTIRQTLFFSATMPKEIRRLADRFLLNPKEISVTPPASAAETVTQGLVRCPGPDKRKALQNLLSLEEVTSALVFCNRKRDVRALAKALNKQGYPAGELHGDMEQSERMETLDRFKNGDMNLLVCSDVAARGLDIPKVSHVFNYDLPANPDDYVHRIGRTGRAGRSGTAYAIATPADAKALVTIEKMLDKPIPPVNLDGVRLLDEQAVEGAYKDDGGKSGEQKPATEKAEGQKAEGKSRRRRGGRGRKPASEKGAPAPAQAAEAVETTAPANANGAAEESVADGPQPVEPSTEAETVATTARDAGEATQQEPKSKQGKPSKGSKRADNDNRGKSAGKSGKEPQDSKRKGSLTQQQTSNGRQSKPFGDHTPAFLLKPVPVSATA